MSIKVCFPLNNNITSEDVFQECINWILDSPFTEFAQEELTQLSSGDDFNYSKNNELIEFSRSEAPGLFVSSLRYTKSTEIAQWITEVSSRMEHGEYWINVVASIVTNTASKEPPEIKKPLIIIRLISRFGGGDDGGVPISINPILLDESRNGKEIAAAVINSNNSCTLPIVYVSSTNNNRHTIIPDRLARALSGMAHVVIEPNRAFSHSLRKEVSSRNVYGGVVGIYWPKGSGVTLFRRDTTEIKAFEKDIFNTICDALSVLISPKKCSWEEVIHVKNRNAIEHLKREGSNVTEAKEIVLLYEAELAEKTDNIQTLNREIDRLSALLRIREAKTPVQGGILINTGDEEDYFNDEILALALHAIKDHLKKSVHPNSRREHILTAILNSNSTEDLHEQKTKTLKEVLRDYRDMNKRVKDTFEDLGFSITADGKHWKVTYQDDERYTYVLPKTASDHRGGLNAAADIANIVY
ncbi:hypothetical protein [Pseudomonas sp. FW305-3-2-15-E-TSA4]|uniref:hypothetical protein n=5 Tax=unclassified Pseudomonas TaxID=196821 RepID=UPI0011AF2BA1|nr:hypothetical protein [Pseudomonas sp. FW305-3-2-15-E-TSA4]